MTPRSDRLLRAFLWGSAGVMAVTAVGVSALALLHPRPPRPLPAPVVVAAPAAARVSAQELAAFARQKMSRAIVKVVPPPPPKPVVPPLDLVIRLSGILDYGPGSPREAFIEIRQSNQTKSYHVGDALASVGAVVKGIGDGVLLEYDGSMWMLTDRGVSPAPVNPVTSSGNKP